MSYFLIALTPKALHWPSWTRIAGLPPPRVSRLGVPALPAGLTAPPLCISGKGICQNQQVNHFVLTSTPDLSQFGITKDKVFTIPHQLHPAPVHRDHLLAASTRPLLPCGVTSHLTAHCGLLLVAMHWVPVCKVSDLCSSDSSGTRRHFSRL